MLIGPALPPHFSILTGHLDGSLHLIGHLGHMTHSVSAHSKPISVMKCSSDYVITGGYDSVVKVSVVHK